MIEVHLVPTIAFVFAIISPLILLDAFAALFGADSRESFVDPRERPDMW